MFKTKRVKREKRLLYSVTQPKKPLTRKVGFRYNRLVRHKKSVDALCCLLAIEHPRFYCYTL